MWDIIEYHLYVCDSCLTPARMNGNVITKPIYSDADLTPDQKFALEYAGWKFMVPPYWQTLCPGCASSHHEGCIKLH